MPIPNLYLNMRQRVLFTLLILTCAVHAKPSHVTRTPKKARTSHLHNKKKSAHEQGPRHTQDEPTPTYQKLLGGLGITALLFLAYKAVSSQQGPIIPPNQQNNTQQNNTQQNNNIAPPNQPNQPNNISANSPQNTTPQPPPKPPYILTKEDIDTFYDLNKDLFDLDELIKTQKQNNKDWQLDDDKMNQWVARMQNAWQDLPNKQKNKWTQYWIRRHIPSTSQGNDRKNRENAIQGQNILHLFAKDYKDRLTKNFVTWDQFKNQVQAVGQDAVDVMQAKNPKDIFFLVPGGMESSHPWIFFVFWKHLKDKIPNNATCHFISPEHTSDIYDLRMNSEYVAGLLAQNTSYQKASHQESLVFIFDDMSYLGTPMRRQLDYFEEYIGYPQNFFYITPFLTHRAKRAITTMDHVHERGKNHYDYDYVNHQKDHYKHRKNKDMKEDQWFPKAPVQFMPSTQVIQEILIDCELLGSKEWVTTPFILPYDIGNHYTTLTAVLAYGIYPMKYKLTQDEVNQFEPISFFKDHAYDSGKKQEIREILFSARDDDSDGSKSPSKKTFRAYIPDILPNSYLPIQPIYKDHTFTFQVKQDDGTRTTKQYNNVKKKYRLGSMEGHGVFEAIKKKLSGT